LPAVPAVAGDNPFERFNVRTSNQSITTNNSATVPKTSGAQQGIAERAPRVAECAQRELVAQEDRAANRGAGGESLTGQRSSNFRQS
jgi:hypothetical protein